MNRRIKAVGLFAFGCALWFVASYHLHASGVRTIDPAEEFTRGNKLYDQGRFAEAITAYQPVVPRTANLYFNLGNAHYRKGELGRAILNYERARRLSPRDPDILANLKFARERLGVDSSESESAIRQFVHRVIFSRTLDEWTTQQITALWLTLAAVALVIWVAPARQIFIGVSILTFLWLSSTAGILGYRVNQERTAPKAIVIAKQAEARFAPLAESTVHFKLTEGAAVSILESRGEWLYVSRISGEEGWIASTVVERVSSL